ncbi:MAG: hypothetical protein HC860_11480 [Alkalinema sp. RU_4_3]|nr:hypothetical protein [Alkalinema sp. RU_4_3]
MNLLKKRQILSLSALALLGFSLWKGPKLFHATQTARTLSDCPRDLMDTAEGNLRPVKVVVEPWEGRHKTYGVFVLPADQRVPSHVAIEVPGKQTYCGRVVKINPHWVGLEERSDQQVVVGLLRTRTALWLVGSGKRGDLLDRENWRLSQGS